MKWILDDEMSDEFDPRSYKKIEEVRMNARRQLAFSGEEFVSRDELERRPRLEDEGSFQTKTAGEPGAEWTDLDFDDAIELLSRSYMTPYAVALGLRRGEPESVRLPFVHLRWKDKEVRP